MSQRSSHFPQPGIKSQLIEAVWGVAISAIRGAESRNRAKDLSSSLNKLVSRKCPAHLLCLSSFLVLLALAWSSEFTFTFAIGESIKITLTKHFLGHIHVNDSYFWGWWQSWQDTHLRDLEILCLSWGFFGNRCAIGGNTFRKVGYWGAVSVLPALGSSRSSLGWVKGVGIGFWIDPNTLSKVCLVELFPLSLLRLIPFLSSSMSPPHVSLLITLFFSQPEICPRSPTRVSSLLYNCLKNHLLQKCFWT